MGQGFYTMVSFGAVLDAGDRPYDPPEGWYEAVQPVADDLGIQIDWSYEASPPCVGIRLAVADAFLADWWTIPLMTRIEGAVATAAVADQLEPDEEHYWAAEVDDLPDALLDRAGRDRVAQAQADWARLRAEVRARSGVEVPEGRFLVVDDWD
jgi:hypothetical protein